MQASSGTTEVNLFKVLWSHLAANRWRACVQEPVPHLCSKDENCATVCLTINHHSPWLLHRAYAQREQKYSYYCYPTTEPELAMPQMQICFTGSILSQVLKLCNYFWTKICLSNRKNSPLRCITAQWLPQGTSLVSPQHVWGGLSPCCSWKVNLQVPKAAFPLREGQDVSDTHATTS